MLVVTKHRQPSPVRRTDGSGGEPRRQQPGKVTVAGAPIPAPVGERHHRPAGKPHYQHPQHRHTQPSPSIIIGDLLPLSPSPTNALHQSSPHPYSTTPGAACAQARGMPVAVILAADDEALIGTVAFIDNPLRAISTHV
jgi:hypothetical protein